MNVEAYISSGILEAYALGELSDRERAEVEKNLAQYPELQKELKLIEEAQERLLMKAAVQPNASVKEKLFATIDSRTPVTKVVELKAEKGRLTFWRFAAAASITLALITSYLAYNYWDKWKSSENNLADLIAQNQRIAQDYNTVNKRLDAIEKDLNITNNPAFNRVVMKGTPIAPGSLASVYWNESTKEVYLSIQEMKQLAQENQYQLWAIIDGKPVDAGVFDGNFSGLLKMKDIKPGAATFAVTVEPRGGKTSPTLETMQVVGNVVKI
ncbi:anti-sigma factor [Chryseolinea sp. H1M3-3]|uniref:anti-sigma factor n=1 Tax=Chryseolinea sp. H1M3-3 TaxID=3034144 RepID=UPI0023ED7330|nr:anti-sigma factor [Chryseolinea sp. H1M3-3]